MTDDTPIYAVLRDSIRAEEPVALATVDRGPEPGRQAAGAAGAEPLGTLGNPDLDRVVARDALGALESGLTSTRHYGPQGEARQRDVAVFVEAFAPPPRMVIFGAVDFTAALVRVAKVLGYRVTGVRRPAGVRHRHPVPAADEVVIDWPDRHLAKVGPGLGPATPSACSPTTTSSTCPPSRPPSPPQAGYIGAMGSRRTHAERAERLREAGVDDAGLARVMGPIGLDIGARTPEETAVSICAEIIALRTGREAPSLRDTEGPIHR